MFKHFFLVLRNIPSALYIITPLNLEMSQVLSNEIWREVVAFIPLENIVNVDYSSTTDVIASYKLERYLKLKDWRNSLFHELLSLWRLLNECGRRIFKAPRKSAVREQIQAEYTGIQERLHVKFVELRKIISLPWSNRKCTVTLTYSRMFK
jgi:hypothetical protein